MRIRGLWKLPGGRDWLWVKLGLALVGRAMLSKSSIQLSADEQGCVSSLFGLRPNYGRGDGGNGNLQKDLCQHATAPRTVIVNAQTLQQATVNHTSAGDSWILIAKSGSVSCETYINKPILINTQFPSRNWVTLWKKKTKYVALVSQLDGHWQEH